jgi:hypothetical protein
MVTIWDRWFVLRRGRRDLPDRVDIDAPTLGDAILEAERIFGFPIRPAPMHDKYFTVGDESEPTQNPSVEPLQTAGVGVPRSWVRRVIVALFPPRSVPRCPPGFGNTDIHIEREGATLCPKQDLNFALVTGDVIVFDALLC